MGKRKLNTWSPLVARTQRFVTLHLWMPAAGKMEEQPSLPHVSIPCHDEQRDKKKRFTVRAPTLFRFSLNLHVCFSCVNLSVFSRFTKCWSAWGSRNGLSSDATQSLINCITQWVVKQRCFQACGLFHLWFMWSLRHFLLLLLRLLTVTETIPVYEPKNPCKKDIWGQFWAWWVASNPSTRCW